MKHAYLIIAHSEPEILKVLLNSLDDERNDVYLHIDKKSEDLYDLFKNYSLRHSQLYVLKDRISVKWGNVSQIEAELLLFETAVKVSKYSYLHLISGVDFPIKSQNFIHDFFTQNKGKEFVGFVQNVKGIEQRVTKIHLFTQYLRGSNKYLLYVTSKLRDIFLWLQNYFGITINNLSFASSAC